MGVQVEGQENLDGEVHTMVRKEGMKCSVDAWPAKGDEGYYAGVT